MNYGLDREGERKKKNTKKKKKRERELIKLAGEVDFTYYKTNDYCKQFRSISLQNSVESRYKECLAVMYILHCTCNPFYVLH